MNLTKGEEWLFAKWWGDSDIPQKSEFWQDALKVYSEEVVNVPLPIQHNPQTVRLVLDMLDCPPGECGECCKYDRIPILPHDLERIIENTKFTMEDMKELIVSEDGKGYLRGTNGCPFLKRNRCIIYKYRPDACYLYPIQSPREVYWDNKKTEQMMIRVKCPQSMEVVKKIIFRALREGDRLLLPNLMVIEKYKEESDGSN